MSDAGIMQIATRRTKADLIEKSKRRVIPKVTVNGTRNIAYKIL